MSSSRIPISHVFTPRSHEVNSDMYIERPSHEKELKRAISGSMHAVVSGSSGSGKTWMCKKVAKDENWATKFANCANAARFKSLTQEICNTLIPEGAHNQTEYSQAIKGGINALGFQGGADATRKYEVAQLDKLEKAFSLGRSVAGKSQLVLVLDNLEAIFSKPELMEELGNILLLLDDDRYAKFNVKFLLIGVPAEIREYYHRLTELEPVSNRLTEILPLRSLSYFQVKEFVKKGFRNQLLVDLSDSTISKWADHINKVTLGLAQRVHEYCEILAYCLEDSNWIPSEEILNTSDNKFIMGSLHKAYAVIEACMNERQTKTSRRNQVLYALGTIGDPEFDAKIVEGRLRELFPSSTNGVALGISQILSELCEQERALLKRISKTTSFGFSDPKYLMALRLVLVRRDNETVSKKLFRR